MYGCNTGETAATQNKTAYFDVKGYFDKESSRLQKANDEIEKRVEVNGSAETRRLRIDNWKSELSIFSDSEINRNSWEGLFKVYKDSTSITYTSDNEKVPVKQLRVTFLNNKVKGIYILVKNTNLLYKSVDSLLYIADSIYSVKKQQDIRFLDRKTYIVTGIFDK